tara:strand:+ start:206 stop:820 length:615 start_codon:yes stop_codon:yes gene_type:complete
MGLTFRTGSDGKGSALTIDELDNNFRHFTGSHSVTGSFEVSGSIILTGSLDVDQTGSFDGGLISSGNIKGTGYLLLNDFNNQFIFANPSTRVVEIYASSSITSGDPAFRVRQDNITKVDFGYDDDGPSEGFAWNYSNGGFKIGTNNTERFKITADGKVGIGISLPTSKLQVVGLAEHTDNAAALTAGLTIGAFYRTGDLLKVVH